ncbi:MAG: RsmB/NOP family class I SAM-dependent RNA methyltransferase [Pacificimonas sp.]
MTPAARTQAAIEILDDVIAAARGAGAAADTLIKRYFKTRRYAGSKDRRAVREITYDCIRALGEIPENGRSAALGARPDLKPHFGGEGHAPAALDDNDAPAIPGIAPAWLLERLGDRAHPALLDRAPIDLRVNSLKATRDDLLHLGTPIADLPAALTGAPDDISRRPEYLDGLVEIQDAGSQRIAALCRAQPGMNVLDLCAGAGGKTLALAGAMRNEGHIIAADTDRGRLSALTPRAERAGATNIRTRLLNPNREMEALSELTGQSDIVLIDAPCSGTGTWRRNPEAKWRLTPHRLDRLTALQARLIRIGAKMVKPGGALVYAVCSLLPEEGDVQADAFAAGDFAETARMLLTPQADGCDGFFIARFEKPC